MVVAREELSHFSFTQLYRIVSTGAKGNCACTLKSAAWNDYVRCYLRSIISSYTPRTNKHKSDVRQPAHSVSCIEVNNTADGQGRSHMFCELQTQQQLTLSILSCCSPVLQTPPLPPACRSNCFAHHNTRKGGTAYPTCLLATPYQSCNPFFPHLPAIVACDVGKAALILQFSDRKQSTREGGS